MAIEIVDLPSYKMVDLSSSQAVNVYQRVIEGKPFLSDVQINIRG